MTNVKQLKEEIKAMFELLTYEEQKMIIELIKASRTSIVEER